MEDPNLDDLSHPDSICSFHEVEEEEVTEYLNLLDSDDLEEEKDDTSYLSLVRRILSVSETGTEDWRRTAIFQTLVSCGDKTRKLIIDGGSCMNVVSESTVERLMLPTEPHPEPYKVAWINSTSIPVTQRCLVPLKQGPYVDAIWCDVIPMTVAHIILGRPWLYDREVMHNGKANTYSFSFDNKHIVLKPLSDETIRKHQEPRSTKFEKGQAASNNRALNPPVEGESSDNIITNFEAVKPSRLSEVSELSTAFNEIANEEATNVLQNNLEATMESLEESVVDGVQERKLNGSTVPTKFYSFNESNENGTEVTLHSVDESQEDKAPVLLIKLGKSIGMCKEEAMEVEDSATKVDRDELFVGARVEQVFEPNEVKFSVLGRLRIDFVRGEGHENMKYQVYCFLPEVRKRRFYHDDFAAISWIRFQGSRFWIIKFFKLEDEFFPTRGE